MERVAPPFPSHRVIRGHGAAAASAVGRRVKVPRARGRTDVCRTSHLVTGPDDGAEDGTFSPTAAVSVFKDSLTEGPSN